MLGKVKNKLIAVFAAALLACGGIAVANWVNAPEEPSVFEPQEFIWVDAETIDDGEVTGPALKIVSNNVSYGSECCIMYRVSVAGFDRTLPGQAVKMLFWMNQPEEYTLENVESVLAEYEEEKAAAEAMGDVFDALPDAYIQTQNSVYRKFAKDSEGNKIIGADGKYVVELEEPVFYSRGIAPKQMTDVVYARAYAEVDGEVYYSDPMRLSVMEYVQVKKAQGVAASMSNLMDAMLDYGAAAQTHFKYNTNKLANATYYKVAVENGTLADGFNYGYYQAGQTVTLQANPAVDANHTFERWVDENGATVSTNETVTVTLPAKDKTYTATYVGDGWTFIDRGTYYDISTFTGTYKDVEVPNTYRGKPVVSIIMNAFRGVTTMETLVVPENIKTIGATAFDGCTALKSVTLSEGLESIGKGAFDGCRNLKSIHIPSTVTQILDAYAPFYGCAAMENITVAAGNTAYSSIDGNLYNANGSKLLRYAIGKADTAFVLPETVTAVGASAIRNAVRLTKIYIPASVVTIETHAIKNLADGAVIYCQNVDNQSGWNANWNLDRYTVEAY